MLAMNLNQFIEKMKSLGVEKEYYLYQEWRAFLKSQYEIGNITFEQSMLLGDEYLIELLQK